MRFRLLIVVLITPLALAACGSNATPAAKPACPLGSWHLTQLSLRSLLGAELVAGTKPTFVSGDVTMQMTDTAMTIEFDKVTLASDAAGSNKTVITGSIVGAVTRTADTLTTTVTNDSVALSVNGYPAGSELTTTVSIGLEKNLLGAATYECAGTQLMITDADSLTATWDRQ